MVLASDAAQSSLQQLAGHNLSRTKPTAHTNVRWAHNVVCGCVCMAVCVAVCVAVWLYMLRGSHTYHTSRLHADVAAPLLVQRLGGLRLWRPRP